MNKIIKQIPNFITMSRMISCALGATFFVTGNIPLALGCYIYGAVSDACDGFIARKLNAVTELGKKLDPISDKLYALSLMAPAIAYGNYFMIIPLVLEGVISGINLYAEKKYRKTHTELVGKIKTITLFPTMILGLFSTVDPVLLPFFIPNLFLSSGLQIGSIKAYHKQLKKFNSEVNNFEFSEKIEITKNDGVSNGNELVQEKNNGVMFVDNYVTLGVKTETRKSKSKILKKPEGVNEGGNTNDRY